MARHPKPPLSAWLVAQRKARGESVEDVGRLLDRSPATIRGWEAGRPPTVEDGSILVLERHYGVGAPREAPPGEDQAALLAAMERNYEKVSELVELLRPMAESQAQQVADLQRAVQRLLFAQGMPTAPGLPAPRETGE